MLPVDLAKEFDESSSSRDGDDVNDESPSCIILAPAPRLMDEGPLARNARDRILNRVSSINSKESFRVGGP
jgi:hypothetical protein